MIEWINNNASRLLGTVVAALCWFASYMIAGYKSVGRAGVNLQLSDTQAIVTSGLLFLFGVYLLFFSWKKYK